MLLLFFGPGVYLAFTCGSSASSLSPASGYLSYRWMLLEHAAAHPESRSCSRKRKLAARIQFSTGSFLAATLRGIVREQHRNHRPVSYDRLRSLHHSADDRHPQREGGCTTEFVSDLVAVRQWQHLDDQGRIGAGWSFHVECVLQRSGGRMRLHAREWDQRRANDSGPVPGNLRQLCWKLCGWGRGQPACYRDSYPDYSARREWSISSDGECNLPRKSLLNRAGYYRFNGNGLIALCNLLAAAERGYKYRSCFGYFQRGRKHFDYNELDAVGRMRSR